MCGQVAGEKAEQASALLLGRPPQPQADGRGPRGCDVHIGTHSAPGLGVGERLGPPELLLEAVVAPAACGGVTTATLALDCGVVPDATLPVSIGSSDAAGRGGQGIGPGGEWGPGRGPRCQGVKTAERPSQRGGEEGMQANHAPRDSTFQAPYTPHCPFRLHTRNADSKIKLVRVSRLQLQAQTPGAASVLLD